MASAKSYRRHRARGPATDVEAGLEALRAMNRRDAGAALREPTPAPAAEPRPGRPRPARARPTTAPGAARRVRSRRRRSRRERGRRWWSLRGLSPIGWALRIAGLICLVVVVWAGLGFWAIWSAAQTAGGGITKTARAALADPHGGILSTPENTLIIGSDARPGERYSRADTIMVMRTDPNGGHIRFLSVPRDTRVAVPKEGEQKINAAFFFHGQRGIIKAVERYTGLSINHIIVVRFNGLSRVVDAVGGIDVSNPTALDCGYSGGIRVRFPAGHLHLNGAQALQYSRVRYNCGDDFARMKRQQQVVAALKSEILSPLGLPLAPWHGADLVSALRTDLSTMDLIKLGWLQATLTSSPADRMQLTGTPQMIGKVSYLIPNDAANEQVLRRFVAR